MPDKKFDLGDYVEVKDRIKLFYELYAKGALVTDQVEILTDPAGKQRVMVRALAFRAPEDPRPAVGHSWLEIPGTTPYTKGSEVENAETSAWGRAIAALGILVDRSIASAQEVANKQDDAPVKPPQTLEQKSEGGLIGFARKQATRSTDFELRESPDGGFLGFRIKEGTETGYICESRGPMAEAVKLLEADVIDKRVQLWGTWIDYKPPTVKYAYRAFRVEQIQTEAWTLPAKVDESELDSLPMFQDDAAASGGAA